MSPPGGGDLRRHQHHGAFFEVVDNIMDTQRGVSFVGPVRSSELRRNAVQISEKAVTVPDQPGYGVQISNLASGNLVESSSVSLGVAAPAVTTGIEVIGQALLVGGMPAARNVYTGNTITGCTWAFFFHENARNDSVTLNVMTGNALGAMRYGSGGPQLLDGLGEPVQSRFRFAGNDVIANGEPQVVSDFAMELSMPLPGAPTYGNLPWGNYWGYDCARPTEAPPATFFAAGGADSSRADVVDSYPFGVPVADYEDYRWAGRRLQAPGCQDLDGDHLQEHEEFRGIDVIDPTTGASVGHLDLPGLGADPDVADIYVEVDYMDNPETTPAVADVRRVVQEFAENGINLHVDLGTAAPGTDLDLGGGNAIPEVDVLSTDPQELPAGSVLSFAHLWTVRQGNLAPPRKPVFHYAVFGRADTATDGRSRGTDRVFAVLTDPVNPGQATFEIDKKLPLPANGVAEIHGDRFTFTRHYTDNTIPTSPRYVFEGVPNNALDPDAINSFHPSGTAVRAPMDAAPGWAYGAHTFVLLSGFGSSVTASAPMKDMDFMHELGHTLGLCHDGICDFPVKNYKPNYPSVMNYGWKVAVYCPWFFGTPPRLAYSHGTAEDLDESSLVEADGVPGLPFATVFTPQVMPFPMRCTPSEAAQPTGTAWMPMVTGTGRTRRATTVMSTAETGSSTY